ncbi:putative leader peptide [Streptomyces clavifer]|uniref:putative leader peptide n=1 Tax=Streptomyces TaxID=1883 RepID=UPI0034D6E544
MRPRSVPRSPRPVAGPGRAPHGGGPSACHARDRARPAVLKHQQDTPAGVLEPPVCEPVHDITWGPPRARVPRARPHTPDRGRGLLGGPGSEPCRVTASVCPGCSTRTTTYPRTGPVVHRQGRWKGNPSTAQRSPTRLPGPGVASLTGMKDRRNLTQRRHIDLARVASAFCCREV